MNVQERTDDGRENQSVVEVSLDRIASPAFPTVASPAFECVAILGVGMMGGSLGLALRANGLAQRVVGVDTNAEGLARAREIGAIDAGTTDLRQGVSEADCVILAAPVAVIVSLLANLVPLVRPEALLTDIGSVKQHIVDVGESRFGRRFVGGHPMSGSPRGGIDAARPTVFTNAPWAIVRAALPHLETDPWVQKLNALILALGARPVLLDSARHDRLAALVSHLPHVLSFAFADMIAAQTDADMARVLAGGSYRDLMRVAQADRAFWQEIFAANRDELLDALTEYEQGLQAFRQTLESLPLTGKVTKSSPLS